MNRIDGTMALEYYGVLQLTCGHVIYLDAHSGPELPAAGEALVYCVKCGFEAQVARIKLHPREVQVVTDWDYIRQHIARDNDPKREAMRLRKADGQTAGTRGLTHSLSDTGVSRDEGAMGAPERASTSGPPAGEDKPSDVLASRIK